MKTTTKVFQSNKSQAVRLPKAVAFPPNVSEVSITTVGVTRVVAPVNQSWDSWFDAVAVTDDFMADRKQSAMQTREAFDD
ncbi:type II toxin-antitoxin system VapB family antitoxin [Arenicella xantha]|uniref:Antitoxin VapB n=1 Tax=Arenicella xantha TaxID=644221 RepID=A0A395JFU9_9GAMM|nr:type II toxin-antitoxin system VapB family antitoxin [Arenicella xantha]RBP48673.1 antitoxin VapB [Arenicella xantha]